MPLTAGEKGLAPVLGILRGLEWDLAQQIAALEQLGLECEHEKQQRVALEWAIEEIAGRSRMG
jgi:hypothetical protein